MRWTGDNRRRGFTMIELVVVLVVAGVLTSIAAPMLSPGRWRADSGVQEVMAALNAAQRLAVLRQHDVIVTFLLPEGAMEVHRDEDNDGAVDAGEDVRLVELPETIGFGLDGTTSMSGDPASSTATFADAGAGPSVAFRRNGSASEAGRIYLRPLRGSMSEDAEASRALTLERSTGELRCFSYRTGAWEPSC